jgi:phosphomannomutase
MKALIVFDLDGTLAESKSPIDTEMANLLNLLVGIVKVAVISGGAWRQFEQQVLSQLLHGEGLKNLSLLPTSGTKFYQYESSWNPLYSEDFTANEKCKIFEALKQATALSQREVHKVWGDVIEDRGSQITFSALGQQAPIEQKTRWDPDFSKRKKIKNASRHAHPGFFRAPGGRDLYRCDKAWRRQSLRHSKITGCPSHPDRSDDLHWGCGFSRRERLSGQRSRDADDRGKGSP